jgi:hypothetical protein
MRSLAAVSFVFMMTANVFAADKPIPDKRAFTPRPPSEYCACLIISTVSCIPRGQCRLHGTCQGACRP